MARQGQNRQTRLGFVVQKLVSGDRVTVSEVQSYGNGIDERTARGDLIALSQLRTRRFRGGIAPANALYSDAQRTKRLEEKLDVAEEAATLFSAHTSIAASPGSTVAMTYAALLEHGIAAAVITNSLALAEHATTEGTSVYLVGGEYAPDVDALVGADAVEGFRRRTPCRQGLLGVSGIDGRGTLYVKHDAEVPVLRAMLEAVEERLVIVANIQKIGKGDPWRIGTLAELASEEREVVLVTNRHQDWRGELGSDYDRAKNVIERLAELEKELTTRGIEFRVHAVGRSREPSPRRNRKSR